MFEPGNLVPARQSISFLTFIARCKGGGGGGQIDLLWLAAQSEKGAVVKVRLCVMILLAHILFLPCWPCNIKYATYELSRGVASIIQQASDSLRLRSTSVTGYSAKEKCCLKEWIVFRLIAWRSFMYTYVCSELPLFFLLHFNYLHFHLQVIPLVMKIVSKFLRLGFDLRPVPMWFMSDKLALGFSPAGVILAY